MPLDEVRIYCDGWLLIMSSLDLPAYFRRIGHTGSTAPTLDTLRALHLAHTMTFVFENLDNWSNRPVSLRLEDIAAKMIAGGRGGYCFETNALFAAVLERLGYRVGYLAARVVWMQPPGARSPRTHMLLRVTLDGRDWIADVGFGAIGQTVPLALDTDAQQATPHETRRFRRDGDVVVHQVELAPGEWADVYRFDLIEAVPADYEVGNWYVATYPDSLFRKSVLVTLPRADHRLTVAFGEFTKRHLDGRAEKRAIRDDADLRRILIEEFGLPASDPAVGGATLTPPANG